MCVYVVISEKADEREVKTFANETNYLSFLSSSKGEGILIEKVFVVSPENARYFDWIVSVCEDFVADKIDNEALEEELIDFIP